MHLKTAVVGLLVAVVLAMSASGATLFGIAFWKIALAGAGAVLFIMARPTDRA